MSSKRHTKRGFYCLENKEQREPSATIEMPEYAQYDVNDKQDCLHLGKIRKDEERSLHADIERQICETCGKVLLEIVWPERDDCSSRYFWYVLMISEEPCGFETFFFRD